MRTISPAPPYPLEGAVSWNMNTLCNYRCTYCTQRFLDSRKQWARDLPAFLDGFRRLVGEWEVKLSGGEPFLHPSFLEAVAALVSSGRRVSVVTNFTASEAVLEQYASLTAGRPGVFSASLHREYVDDQAFLEKVSWYQGVFKGPVCVTCVATAANLPALPALRERYREHGVVLKVQPEKVDRDVRPYFGDELEQLLALGGHNNTGAVAASFAGQPCWAGARYFVLDHRGDAWRCYPARRYRTEPLGNFLSPEFRLGNEARACRYDYCNCTVPIERGMMGGRS